MSNLLCTIEGKCKVDVYDDGHAEIILSNGQRAMIDAGDANRCSKDHKWYFNVRSIRATDGDNISLGRYIMNAEPNNTVRFADGDIFNCRRENLILTTKNEPAPKPVTGPKANQIIIYKDKGYAELVLKDNKTYEELRAKIDLDDVDRIKDMYWTYNPIAIQNNSGRTLCLHRYIMNADAYGKVYVKFRNGDKLDCRKSNLYITHSTNCDENGKVLKPATTVIESDSESIPVQEPEKNNYTIIHTDKGYSVFFIYNGQTYDLGRYNSEEEAKYAIYDKISDIYKELDPLGLYNMID